MHANISIKEKGPFMSIVRKRTSLPWIVAVVLGAATQVLAEDFTSVEAFQKMPLAYPKFMIDNLWVLIAAALVFIMHLGKE